MTDAELQELVKARVAGALRDERDRTERLVHDAVEAERGRLARIIEEFDTSGGNGNELELEPLLRALARRIRDRAIA
jgi:hypothetical protein